MFLKVKLRSVCALSSLCCSLWGESLCPFWSRPLSTGMFWWGSTWAFSREKRPYSFSLSLQGRPPSPLNIIAAFLQTLSNMLMSFLPWGGQKGAFDSQVQPDRCRVEWNDHICTSVCNVPCNPQDSTLFLQQHTGILYLVVSGISLSLKSFPERLLTSHIDPVLYWALSLFQPRYRILHLV